MRTDARFVDPSSRSVDDVRSSASAISIEGDGLGRWFRDYVGGQSERLAVDLDIIEAFVPPTAAILEVGALPLILTLALAGRGLRVTGVDIDPSRCERTHLGASAQRCVVRHRDRGPPVCR